jgi:hypothetical protein
MNSPFYTPFFPLHFLRILAPRKITFTSPRTIRATCFINKLPLQLIERVRYCFLVSCTSGRELRSRESDMSRSFPAEFPTFPPVAYRCGRFSYDCDSFTCCSAIAEQKLSCTLQFPDGRPLLQLCCSSSPALTISYGAPLATRPHFVPNSKRVEAIPSLPTSASCRVSGQLLPAHLALQFLLNIFAFFLDRLLVSQSTVTLVLRFTDFRFSNFRYDKPLNFIAGFQFTNIIFATAMNQLSSKGRASAS